MTGSSIGLKTSVQRTRHACSRVPRELPCCSERPQAKPVLVSGPLLRPPAHRAIVTAQLLLVPEAQVQPIARHVQVLRAEAGAAAEASPSGCRHGEVAELAA